MRDQKSNIKAPLLSPMHIALLLLCAVLISSYAISGLYARYISKDTSGDSARVARFAFTENSGSQSQIVSASLAPGGKETITIQIENKGEVAVRYVVSVTNQTNNIPLAYYVLTADPNNPTPFENVQDKNGEPTNTYIGQSGIIKQDTTVQFSWIIEWPSGDEFALDRVGKMDYVQITVSVEQVD